MIPDISEKMLTQRLQSFAKEGIVSRTVLGDSPPHVQYDLTADGRSLAPALQALYDWGMHWADRQGLTIESPTRQWRAEPARGSATQVRILSRTGSRWVRKTAGFSDIGKWPMSSISLKVEPAIASCAARPDSMVAL